MLPLLVYGEGLQTHLHYNKRQITHVVYIPNINQRAVHFLYGEKGTCFLTAYSEILFLSYIMLTLFIQVFTQTFNKKRCYIQSKLRTEYEMIFAVRQTYKKCIQK